MFQRIKKYKKFSRSNFSTKDKNKKLKGLNHILKITYLN